MTRSPMGGSRARRRIRPRSRRRIIIVAAAAAVMTVGAATTVSWAAGYPASRTYSFFTGTQPTSTGSPTADLKAAEAQAAGAALDRDHAPVELGLKFMSSQSGRLTAVRFLQPAEDAGEHRVSVWSASGRRLATALAPAGKPAAPARTAPIAWREVALPAPVALRAGATYTVSYHANRYLSTVDYFRSALRVGPLSAPARSNGVYSYGAGDAVPAHSWRASNYWVDVVVAAAAGPPGVPDAPTEPTATGTPTAVPTAPTATPTPAPAPSQTGGPVKSPPAAVDLPRVPWEGGPDYYGKFPSARPWTDPNFFPIGVWF